MRLLDLYCCAGGAAMGYHRAGFDEIVGVDIEPQPRYPFTFIQGDALEYVATHGHEYDAIHSSPPCQHASTVAKQVRTMRPGRYEHPNLIPQTRELLIASGLPYVIENVMGAELINPVELCGSWFGLDIRRHRLFEVNFPAFSTPCSHYWQKPRFISLDKRRKRPASVVPVHGWNQLSTVVGVHGHLNYHGEKKLREDAMGIDWMNPHELTQAVPPAYSEYIGKYLMEHLRSKQA